MFIQLISCVSFSRHTQASRHTHAHAAEGHVQKTDSQMTGVLKDWFNGKWKWKIQFRYSQQALSLSLSLKTGKRGELATLALSKANKIDMDIKTKK